MLYMVLAETRQSCIFIDFHGALYKIVVPTPQCRVGIKSKCTAKIF